MAQGAEAERVHQGVALIGAVKIDVPGHGRNPDAVAVVRYARHDAAEEPLGDGRIELAESERVGEEHRARPHRENVADDPTDAGRGPLKGLDGARVVVRLDLERDRPSVADVDDARVLLARLHEDAAEILGRAFLLGREALEQGPRVLVRAVLRPHNREDPKLGEGRHAAQVPAYLVVFLGEEPVLLDQLRGDRLVEDRVWIGRQFRAIHAALSFRISGNRFERTARATLMPSRLGWNLSKQRSGWGIIPNTLPSSLRMPAIDRREPFGLST